MILEGHALNTFGKNINFEGKFLQMHIAYLVHLLIIY